MNINISTPKQVSGISINIHKINTPLPTNETLKLKIRGYGHKVAIDLFGLDVRLTGDNFNHVDFYDTVGRWSAVTKFYTDIQDVLSWIRGLHETWTSEMENWLIGDVTEGGTPARPMWWDIKNDERVLRCGASVFGENVVMVESENGSPVEYVYDDLYPAESSGTRIHPIVFYRVIGMKKSDVGNVSHDTHPWFVHKCNQANSKPVPNTIDWFPKGKTIYYPILDYSDWPVNTKYTIMLLPKVMFY